MKTNAIGRVMLGVLFLSVARAGAATYTWANAGGGFWDTAGNWQGGVAPPDAADHTADFRPLPSGITVTLRDNRQIGHLVFTNDTGQGRYLYGWNFSANRTLTLATTAGTPTITVDGTGGTVLTRIVLAGTQGLMKRGQSGLELSAKTSAGADASTLSGTLTVAEGQFWVSDFGRLPNLTSVVISNRAQFLIYDLNSDLAAMTAGRVNPAATYRLDGGGSYVFQTVNYAAFAYSETMAELRNAMGYSPSAVGKIQFYYQNLGNHKSLTVGSLTHDLGAALLINNPALTAWDDTTYRITISAAQGASGTAISGSSGTSIIPYLRAGGNGDFYYNDSIYTHSGFLGLTAAGNVRPANWNPLGSTSTTWVNGDNVRFNTNPSILSVSNSYTINALFAGASGNAVRLNNSQITISSGLLSLWRNNGGAELNGGSTAGYDGGGGFATITAGTPGVGGELMIYSPHSSGNSCYVWSTHFTDNAGGTVNLTKLNGGVLILYGPKNNTYSGRTTISEGSVDMEEPVTEVAGSGSQLGLVPSSVTGNSVVIMNNAALVSGQHNRLHANRGIGVAGQAILGCRYGMFTILGPIADFSADVGGSVVFDGLGTVNTNNLGIYSSTAGWVLGGASTYSGSTTINAGPLRLTNGSDRLPAATRLTLNGTSLTYPPILDLNGCNQALAGLSGGAGASKGIVTNSGNAATLTLTGAGSFDGTLTDAGTAARRLLLAVDATNATVTFTGAAHTYSSNTTIRAGTLALAGSATITQSPLVDVWETNATLDVSGLAGTFTLGAAQTLTGLGTVSGPMTVAGTVRPGHGIGTLSVGAATFSGGGTLAVELSGTTNDTLVVNGDFDISAGTLTVTGGAVGRTEYTIARYTGTLTGTFATVTGLPVTYASYAVDYGTGSNSAITLIPPPRGTIVGFK
ncbi:MAG: autotransporter-associated beta strand repeat-containing protein [Lentisphaerae bacterium]|nr:autotransporter-associated beta strand repeat-containing protein [Lentisphaerota bacterium]